MNSGDQWQHLDSMVLILNYIMINYDRVWIALMMAALRTHGSFTRQGLALASIQILTLRVDGSFRHLYALLETSETRDY